jgi:molybdopterin-containing oxidoreductase family membrane subunit
MDFATSVVPGWHTTIFPPYFVAGAIFSGFGMVLTLLVIVRKVMNYQDYITIGHLEAMCKVVMLTGTMVGLAYITEFFVAAYSGVVYEQYAFINRATGPYWWAYWSMMTCNVISPQLFWFRKIRTSIAATFALSIVVNIGMWFERFVIIVTSLHRDYLPSSWAMFYPTITDVGLYLFSFGLFFTLFFLFAKFFALFRSKFFGGTTHFVILCSTRSHLCYLACSDCLFDHTSLFVGHFVTRHCPRFPHDVSPYCTTWQFYTDSR